MRRTTGNTILPLIVNFLQKAKYELIASDGYLMLSVRGTKDPPGGLDLILKQRVEGEPILDGKLLPQEVILYTPTGTFQETYKR